MLRKYSKNLVKGDSSSIRKVVKDPTVVAIGLVFFINPVVTAKERFSITAFSVEIFPKMHSFALYTFIRGLGYPKLCSQESARR